MSQTGGPTESTNIQERHHRSMWRLTFVIGLLGIVLTAIGTFSGLFTWLGIGPNSETPTPVADAPHGTQTTAAVSDKPAGTMVGLESLPMQAGNANLTSLPKALREDQTYAGALVIECPTNQSTDKSREVTYLLRGQYSQFEARIQSSFTRSPDLRAVLTVVGVYQEIDGTLATRELSADLAATTQLSIVSADVEKAEELILRVRCDEPGGVVILLGGQLSRA
jgi:hypothetical protein